jgi:hypothetical protein
MSHPEPQPDQQLLDQLSIFVQERNMYAQKLEESLSKYTGKTAQGYFVFLHKPENVKRYEEELRAELRRIDAQIDKLIPMGNRRYT